MTAAVFPIDPLAAHPPSASFGDTDDQETEAFYRFQAEAYALASQALDVGPARQQFMERIEGGRRILDAGCGGGRDLAAFRRHGLVAEGLEQSPELAAIAERHSGCRVTVGDLRSPPYRDGSFDGIWAAASLLHLSRAELLPTLRELKRILAPDGLLFASVKLGRGTVRHRDGRRFSYHQPGRWRDLLESAGFQSIAVEVEQDRWTGRTGRRPWIQSFASAS